MGKARIFREKGRTPVTTNPDDLFWMLLAAGFGGWALRGLLQQFHDRNVLVAWTAVALFLAMFYLVTREFRNVWRTMVFPQPNAPLRTGLLPPLSEEEAPRLKLAHILKDEYKASLTIPQSFNWYESIISWPMYANDELGDCTAADVGHQEQIYTAYGQGKESPVSNTDVINFYSLCSGYNGTPNSDRGAVLQKVQDTYRKTGIAGRKIAAFFQVDPSDPVELKSALYLFGGVAIGFPFPASAMTQFRQGVAWTDNPKLNNTIDGGHDVLLVGYDPQYYYVVTWGKLQKVDVSFWNKYMCSKDGEAWGRASQEWINGSSLAPNALDVSTLNAQFTALTGQPGPFQGAVTPTPAPTPQPTPKPTPTPVPQPVPATTLTTKLVQALVGWLPSSEVGRTVTDKLFVAAAKKWLKSKGVTV